MHLISQQWNLKEINIEIKLKNENAFMKFAQKFLYLYLYFIFYE